MPRLAQKGLNESDIILVSQNLSDPRAGSVHLRETNLAQSNSPFHPMFGSFDAALFLESTEPNIKPFAYTKIPEVRSTGNSSIVMDQPLHFVDTDQFGKYVKYVLTSETYRLALRGRCSVKLGPLKEFKVDFNKVITAKGKKHNDRSAKISLC